MTKIALRKMLNEELTLRKKTETPASSVFGTKVSSFTDYSIKGIVRIITLEDLRFMAPGILEVGNGRGFFFSEYDVETALVSVETGDRIIDSRNVEWRVDRILKYPIHEEDVVEARLVRV